MNVSANAFRTTFFPFNAIDFDSIMWLFVIYLYGWIFVRVIE